MTNKTESIANLPSGTEIGTLLSSLEFPLNRDGLVDAARREGADNDVIASLEGLPEQDYDSAAAVVQFIGSAGGGGLGGG